MILFMALLLWTQAIYPASATATASPSTASDIKSGAAGEKERKAIPSMVGSRTHAVQNTTGMLSDLALLTSQYAHEYPEIPRFVDAVAINFGTGMSSTGVNRNKVPENVVEWLNQDPNNVNAVQYQRDGNLGTSLLMLVLWSYVLQPHAREFLDMIFTLRPNVRYKCDPCNPADALSMFFYNFRYAKLDHNYWDVLKKLLDMLLEQGANPQEIEAELKRTLPEFGTDEASQYLYHHAPSNFRSQYEMRIKLAHAALEYLHDLQAAPIVEEEMARRLGIRDLGVMSAEYVEPSYKKHKRHTHHRKSNHSDKGEK